MRFGYSRIHCLLFRCMEFVSSYSNNAGHVAIKSGSNLVFCIHQTDLVANGRMVAYLTDVTLPMNDTHNSQL